MPKGMTKSFFNDNARPHVARPVKEALERMRYDIPLPYSPDLAPSDDLISDRSISINAAWPFGAALYFLRGYQKLA